MACRYRGCRGERGGAEHPGCGSRPEPAAPDRPAGDGAGGRPGRRPAAGTDRGARGRGREEPGAAPAGGHAAGRRHRAAAAGRPRRRRGHRRRPAHLPHGLPVSAADRLRARAVAAAEVTGLMRVRRQRARVAEVEVAVRENALLDAELAVVVRRMEEALVPLLEARARR
ncbi:hypothetical protein F9L07_19150 [Pimelobacter simplex]|uniref:Uncharacterized protein n=1 Tax=Nocardioides simplex TaxID=2045 RepID=A0A7J5DV39_NOCSI|nr:hypothetical protein F9L07_19150 [Pimelobacter simplex]